MKKTVWNVLIADDEPIIREGIRDSVDWSSLSMNVIAEAEDGEEALELSLKYQVDILLVDLNMPIMNGLSLIKEIRNKLPSCKVVIITGHDEFKYAQEAVRLQVTDYILKPADPLQLREVLLGVKKQLEEFVKQDELLSIASSQLAKNMPLLREKFAREWSEGKLEDAEVQRQLSFLELPMEIPKQLVMIHCPEYSAKKPFLNEKEKGIILTSIRNEITCHLEAKHHILFLDVSERFVVIIWDDYQEQNWCQIEHDLYQALQMSVNIVKKHIEESVGSVQEVYQLLSDELENEAAISPIVRRAKQFITENYTDPSLTLERVASHLHVSPVYLSRIIKQELGVSFVRFVTNMRIQKSIELLNQTDMPIVEIAEMVGYDTQHYFSTAFKKVTGVSPIKYRKQNMML
ncbi:response regulator transcription factor [Metabacillus niabensis]|uniref:response regulator transcription factor n=1 Tax=Metabacillus TaxID=2675233 RepID=UPI0011A9805F